MPLPSRRSIESVAFVVSLVVLALLYGYAARALGWFPDTVLQRAARGAQVVLFEASPHWRHPTVYDRVGARVVRPERVQPGLTLVASWWKDSVWAQGLKLIDSRGRTVHEWRIDADDVFPDPPDIHARRQPGNTSIHGVHLFPDGDVLLNISYVGTARLDACGRVLWRLPAGSHHSIAQAEDGTFWITAGTYEPRSEEASDSPDRLPGVAPTYRDRILHVTGGGRILSSIGVLEVLYRNDLQRYIPKGSAYPPSDKNQSDLTHLNDVEPLGASLADQYPSFAPGDLVVSLRHLDLVLVLAPESRRVKWHATRPFIQQHDPDFIGGGWIGVLDNARDGTRRGTMLGGSRIVAVQPHTDSTRVLFPGPRSEPFYTDVQGKWQLLDNGNMLLTESQAGRVVEVAPDGRTVWEWVVPPGDDGTVPEVTEGTRYDLTREEVASWPCSPEQPSDGGQARRRPGAIGGSAGRVGRGVAGAH